MPFIKDTKPNPASSTQLRTPMNYVPWCPLSHTGALATQLLKRPTLSVLLRTQDWPRGSWARRQYECHLPYRSMHLVWFHAPDPVFPKKFLLPPSVLPHGVGSLVPPCLRGSHDAGCGDGQHQLFQGVPEDLLLGGLVEARACLGLPEFALGNTQALLCCIFMSKEQVILCEGGRI